MKNPFKLLIFDWDGTLFDSAAAIVQSMQAACEDIGLPPPSEEKARYVIGLGLADALRHAVPQLSEDQMHAMMERYKYHYHIKDQSLTLFEGIAPLIASLHAQGVTLAVATGKSRRGLDRVLAHSGLGCFFTTSRCADECFSKPHPQMIHEIMETVGCPPEATLMIGDTTHDLYMAQNAKVTGLGVSYGAHSKAALSALGFADIVDHVPALSLWLQARI